ncbi:hypothetical protein WH47_11982 [Habropoda laboriosa]|uniref:Uncharacterized protein n=1 Tax=Habropoda laboriosa TaxID=597456 RepID=A0A0L7QLR4_9HYME|nr:hypothetical protein WH47_11982 [Habropoda laboriosa]
MSLPYLKRTKRRETHLKIPNYIYCGTPHPSDKARGGSGIFIKKNIRHTNKFVPVRKKKVNVTLNTYDINVSAIYCPPKHAITTDEYDKGTSTRNTATGEPE